MNLSGYHSLLCVIAFSALTLGGCHSSTDKTAEQATAPKGIDISLFAKEAFTQGLKSLTVTLLKAQKRPVTSLLLMARQQDGRRGLSAQGLLLMVLM